MEAKYFYDSPIGIVCIEEKEGEITALHIAKTKEKQ